MGTGVILCGLNGAGKSTLGKALAKRLGFHFIDAEDLYFPKTGPNHAYAASRTKGEVEALLLREIETHKNFVFASVRGNFGVKIEGLFNYAVLVDVPKEIRMQRIRQRSFEKFGGRMLPGGDLYEQEQAFFDMAAAREDDHVEAWVAALGCPLIRVDGTKPIGENVDLLVKRIKG